MTLSPEHQLLVDSCDARLVADQFRLTLQLMREEAAATGMDAYLRDDAAAAIDALVRSPTHTAVRDLIAILPSTIDVVAECAPGGSLFELEAMLRGRGLA